ncbi:MAG: glycosyltransferase family 4 protein [Gammaproteobacteria bacterium]|nr:glycosyltransferase family 4 protein [Gammaproteobacteria bacterium]
MRILMLTSEYPPRIGGVATLVAELTHAVRSLGHEVTVLAPAKPVGADPESGVIRYSPRLRAQPFSDWLLGVWCRRWLARNPCDLLHVHGLRPLRAALSTGLPVVFTNHTSGFLQTVALGGRRLRRLGALISRCSHVIAPSEELVAAAREAGYEGSATYVPNGVDAARFHPSAERGLRAAWGIPEGARVVVLARRLVPKNGVMDAARALAETTPDVHFVFAGDGPEKEGMARVIAEAGVQSRAHFIGGVPNPQMPDVYHAADFCLLPSHMEATSIAGLEAMACGRALVGTLVGGIPALIDEGVTGLLVPPRDPATLALAVNRLASDSALCARMGAAARARVEREFSWERIAEQTTRVYGETLSRHFRIAP